MNELKLDYLLLELKYIVDTFNSCNDFDIVLKEEDIEDFVYKNVKEYLSIEDALNCFDDEEIYDVVFNEMDEQEILGRINDRYIIEYIADNMSVDDVVCFNY